MMISETGISMSDLQIIISNWHGLSFINAKHIPMPASNQKRIGKHTVKKEVSSLDTLRGTWTVMKPFVHFSIKSMRVIAHALIFIVKNIPKPEEHKPVSKSNKVIKV